MHGMEISGFLPSRDHVHNHEMAKTLILPSRGLYLRKFSPKCDISADALRTSAGKSHKYGVLCWGMVDVCVGAWLTGCVGAWFTLVFGDGWCRVWVDGVGIRG